MRQTRVVWASPDLEYVERLLAYVQLNEQDVQWHFHTFTNVKLCNQYMQEASQIDLFVVDAAWSKLVNTSLFPTVLLTDSSGATEQRTLFKYQPLPKLFAKLQTFTTVENEGEDSMNTEQKQSGSQVIAIYSAAGGTGKTTTALQILKLARKRLLRSFYLNLEMIQAVEVFGRREGEEDAFARLLYYMQADMKETETRADRKKIVAAKLDELKLYNDHFGYDYIPAFHHLVNRLELGSREVRKLIELLSSSRNYDLIVLDLDTFLHESTITALTQSDRILWLVADDLQCIEKTNIVLKELNASSEKALMITAKTDFILNKFTGGVINDISMLPIKAELPYIPEWKFISSITSLEAASLYMQKLQQIMDKFFVPLTTESEELGSGSS